MESLLWNLVVGYSLCIFYVVEALMWNIRSGIFVVV